MLGINNENDPLQLVCDDIANLDISIEEIADKYFDCSQDYLRDELIKGLYKLRKEIILNNETLDS